MQHKWYRVVTLNALLSLGIACSGAVIAQAENNQANISVNAQRAAKLTRPYHADYVLSRRGRTHGNAGRTLTAAVDGTWTYQTFTDASLLIFSDRRAHETNFRIVGDRVVPLAFQYNRTGTGSGQFFAVVFDYANKKLVRQADSSLEAEWKEGLLDSNAVLHQLQIDVAGSNSGIGAEWTYQLIDERGRNTEYTFRSMGYETVQVPYGTMDTIRVMRVRETDRRETYFWFSPLHNYSLVQMQQLKEGKEQAKLMLRTLEYN